MLAGISIDALEVTLPARMESIRPIQHLPMRSLGGPGRNAGRFSEQLGRLFWIMLLIAHAVGMHHLTPDAETQMHSGLGAVGTDDGNILIAIGIEPWTFGAASNSDFGHGMAPVNKLIVSIKKARPEKFEPRR